MSNKHLACVILGTFLFFIAYGTLMVHGKLTAVQEQVEAARAAAEGANSKVLIKRMQLVQLQKNTAPLRDYLKQWQPYLDNSAVEDGADIVVKDRLTKAQLVSFRRTFTTMPQPGNAYLPNIKQASLSFEDDFVRCLQFVGDFEVSVPTSRVSSLKIVKGANANDIKMDCAIDLPLIVTAETKTK